MAWIISMILALGVSIGTLASQYDLSTCAFGRGGSIVCQPK